MVSLPDAPWRQRPELMALVSRLGGGAETRIVGGAVRDSLIGRPVSDIDMATRLTPQDVLDRLRTAGTKAVPTGLAHGTVTAVLKDGPVEITTLRRDVSTDGRHAEIAYTDDWREDASRRDFTVNALYADAETGEIFDWFGGIDDLEAGRVRFIGDPVTRIAEDHLRILRFFRFHARFGRGAPDEAGYAACIARRRDLMALSRERIASELLKLLGSERPVGSLALLIESDILASVLPEIDDGGCQAVARLIEREAAAGLAGDPVRRLIALMPADGAVADTLVVRLKLSNAIRKRVARLKAVAPEDLADVRALAYRLGKAQAADALLLYSARAEKIGPALDELERFQIPGLPLSGGDLIARGLAPGPIVARTLALIEDRWVAAGFPVGGTLDEMVDATIAEAAAAP